MKAIVLSEPGNLTTISVGAMTSPGDAEVLIRVRRIGVCGTDIHAFGGRQPFFAYPRILGHELGVEVLAVGEKVQGLRAGDRCAVEPYLHCGTCIACSRGRPNCCTQLTVLGVHSDGGMREEFLLPADKLHRSNDLSFDQLALVEPLAIGCHAVERAGLQKGEYALVIGAGPIGLSVMQFAVEKGARVIVLDIHEGRLAFCKEQMGVAHLVNAKNEDVLARLHSITGGDLPTAVFDATGSPHSMGAAFDYPAHGGRLVFVGLFQGDVSFNDPNFHRRELTLLASRNALPGDFRRIIHLIEAGRIDTRPWITHRARFRDVPALFSHWTKPENGVIKAMIEV